MKCESVKREKDDSHGSLDNTNKTENGTQCTYKTKNKQKCNHEQCAPPQKKVRRKKIRE